MEDWRQPKITIPPQKVYARRPPRGNKIKELQFALEQIKHNHTDYEDCSCCYHQASLLMPHLIKIFHI